MTTNKINFMSRPSTTIADRRTWLIKIGDEPDRHLVRVYPIRVRGNGSAAKFVCDCKQAEPCRHVKAAIVADNHRFLINKKAGK